MATAVKGFAAIASFASTAAATAAAVLNDKVEKVVPEIKVIIEACSRKTSGITQPSVDKIVKMCLDNGVAVQRNVMPRNCGIHPENRARSGVDPVNAQNLTLKISNQGYSETKLENPMGFEKQLEGQLRDVQEKFCEQNFTESNGYLKTIPWRDIEYLPVTCSHACAAVNIVQGEGPGLHEELCNGEGNIDMKKVLELCPSWEQAMTKGIPCTVFKRELDVACPELAAFLSKAGNQSHDVHGKETKVQLMLALVQHYQALKRRSESATSAEPAPSWDRVVQDIVGMKPHFKECAAEAAEFASAWSMGDGYPTLIEVEQYSKQLRARRELETGQLALLANAKFSRAPRWAIACLKALLSAPDCKCSKKGEAKLFCSNDMRLMESKHMPKILQATVMIDKAREWFGRSKEEQPALTASLIGKMEERLVFFVMGITVKTRVTYETMEAIGMELAKEVKDKGGDMTECPWKLPKAKGDQIPKDTIILEYGSDGSMSASQLKNAFGMELGTTVARKPKVSPKVQGDSAQAAPDLIYHIGKIDGPTVTLVGVGENTSQATVTMGELVDLYHTKKFQPDIVVRAADIPAIDTYTDVVNESLKSSMRWYLLNAFRLYQSKARIDLQIKQDSSHIFASGDYKVGQMILVPFSKNLLVGIPAKVKNLWGAKAAEVKILGPMGVAYVVILHKQALGIIPRDGTDPLTNSIVVPYWLARAEQDKTIANMKFSSLTCTLSVVAGGEEAPHRVSLPIMTNTKAVKGGDELVVFAEPRTSSIRPPQKLDQPPSKKKKVADK